MKRDMERYSKAFATMFNEEIAKHGGDKTKISRDTLLSVYCSLSSRLLSGELDEKVKSQQK